MTGVALTGLRFQDEIAELPGMDLQRAKSAIPVSFLYLSHKQKRPMESIGRLSEEAKAYLALPPPRIESKKSLLVFD